MDSSTGEQTLDNSQTSETAVSVVAALSVQAAIIEGKRRALVSACVETAITEGKNRAVAAIKKDTTKSDSLGKAEKVSKVDAMAGLRKKFIAKAAEERGAREEVPAVNVPKKRAGVSAAPVQMDVNYKPPSYPKSAGDRVGIQKAIRHFFAFSAMLDSREQRDLLIDAFEMREFSEDVTLIEQGSEGLEFFVLLSGDVECSVKNVGVVKTCRGDTPDCYFGELALLYNNPRAATVVTKTPVKAAVLDQGAFKHIIPLAQKLGAELRLKSLQNITRIRERAENEQHLLLDAMQFASFANGSTLLRMPFDGGDEIILDQFCVVLSGQVAVVRTKNAGGKQMSEVLTVQDVGNTFAKIKLEEDDSTVVVTVTSEEACKALVTRQSTMSAFGVQDDFWLNSCQVRPEVSSIESAAKPARYGHSRRTNFVAPTEVCVCMCMCMCILRYCCCICLPLFLLFLLCMCMCMCLLRYYCCICLQLLLLLLLCMCM